MDTTSIILADTLLAAVANQASDEAKDPNSFAIFIMGMAGVFAFCLVVVSAGSVWDMDGGFYYVVAVSMAGV